MNSLLASVDRALRVAREIVADVLAASNQMQVAARLTDRLSALELSIEAVADRVSRRYFTLLPIARSLSMDAEPASRSGVEPTRTGQAWSPRAGRARHEVSRQPYQQLRLRQPGRSRGASAASAAQTAAVADRAVRPDRRGTGWRAAARRARSFRQYRDLAVPGPAARGLHRDSGIGGGCFLHLPAAGANARLGNNRRKAAHAVEAGSVAEYRFDSPMALRRRGDAAVCGEVVSEGPTGAGGIVRSQ